MNCGSTSVALCYKSVRGRNLWIQLNDCSGGWQRENGILIKFKGEANVQWTETESRKNSDGTTEEHTVYFQGNEKYFESKYHLVGGHD